MTVTADDLNDLPSDMIREISRFHPLLIPPFNNKTLRRAVRDYLAGGEGGKHRASPIHRRRARTASFITEHRGRPRRRLEQVLEAVERTGPRRRQNVHLRRRETPRVAESLPTIAKECPIC